MQTPFSMRLRGPRARKDMLACCALALLIVVEWGAIYGIFRTQPLLAPTSYWGDAQFNGAVVAAARRGEYLPFASKQIPSLGAPFVARWDDFPINEDVLFFFVGQLARVVGVFGAINIFFCLACVLAGVSMFLVSRRLRANRPGAFLAGMLYGLSPYVYFRAVHHFSLDFYFFVPWVVLAGVRLASRRGIPFGSQRFKSAAFALLACAWSMIYFPYFCAQILGLAVVARWARYGAGQWRTWVALAMVVFAGVLSMQADTLVNWAKNGVNPAVTGRNPSDVELYALKPINYFAPALGPDHLALTKRLSDAQSRQHVTSGEAPAPYLGLVGGAAFLALMLTLAVKIARRRVDLIANWGLASIVVTIFNGVGGLNSVLGLAGFTLFRSVNRASIVVFTYVMLFLAWGFRRLTRRLPAAAQWAVALALGLFGGWEHSPAPNPRDANAVALFESDRALVVEAERVLPTGAHVFCLPPQDFPESPSSGLDSYEMFRPYFTADHLVFSNGDIKGRPNGRWKFDVASKPLPEMFAELKRNGFSAIYINLRPYGGRRGLVALQQAGASVIAVASANDSAFLSLPP